MSEQEWTLYSWRLVPTTPQLRTVQVLLLALVGTAVVVIAAALASGSQLRVYALPAALLVAAAVVWQQRSRSLDYRLAVNGHRDLVVSNGRGRREIIPLEGAEVALRRERVARWRVVAPWRWALEVRTVAGHEGVHRLPAFAGCFHADEADARAMVTELTRLAAAADLDRRAPAVTDVDAGPGGRDRSRFEWRHPRLSEIAHLRRRLRVGFAIGAVAVAVATAVALWGDELSAIPPMVGVGAGVALVVVAAAVDWVFRLPFRWVLRVDPDGVLRVSNGSRDRQVRLTGAVDVIVGRRRPQVADGEIASNGSAWAVAVVRPEGKHFEAAIPSIAGWAELRPADAVALERVLRRRAGLPVR